MAYETMTTRHKLLPGQPGTKQEAADRLRYVHEE